MLFRFYALLISKNENHPAETISKDEPQKGYQIRELGYSVIGYVCVGVRVCVVCICAAIFCQSVEEFECQKARACVYVNGGLQMINDISAVLWFTKRTANFQWGCEEI